MAGAEHHQKRYRTSVLFARDAPIAVLLLRHGRNHFHLIEWQTKKNTFVHGQWMRGDIHLTDLSSDGTKLLYFAAQRHKKHDAKEVPSPLYNNGSMREIYAHQLKQDKKRRRNRKVPRYMGGGSPKKPLRRPPVPLSETWTALSKVPYFTALAFWPAFGAWTGGGVFSGQNEVTLFEDEESLTPHLGETLPKHFRVRSGFDLNDTASPLTRCASSPFDQESDEMAGLLASLVAQGLTRADWVYENEAETLRFSGDGKLYQLADLKSFNFDEILENASLVADFSDQTFTQKKAPPKSTS